jgi:DNA-binding winged helix-turn-helix (wHTH) protein
MMVSGYRLGCYTLYPQPGLLFLGDRQINLTPTDIAVLTILAKHSGSTVPKTTFFQIVWFDTPIHENNLPIYIKNLRRSMGRASILTQHRHGYQINLLVEPLGTPEEMHTWYLMALFERAETERQRTDDDIFKRIYGPELDNLRRALDWGLASPGRIHIAVALGGASARLWTALDLAPEGRRYVMALVDRLDDDTPVAHAARLLKSAGTLWREVDRQLSSTLLRRSAALYRQLQDYDNLGSVLGLIGGACVHLGQYQEARIVLIEAEKLLSTTSHNKSLLSVFNELGVLSSLQKKPDEAYHYFGLARDLARGLKDPLRENIILLNIGEVDYGQGFLDRAVERAREASKGLQNASPSYRVRALINLATYLAILGRFPESAHLTREAFPLTVPDGGFWLRLCLQLCALHASDSGEYVKAALLRGFVNHGFLASGEIRQPAEADIDTRLMERLKSSIGTADAEIWFMEGSKWDEATAITFAQDRLMQGDIPTFSL